MKVPALERRSRRALGFGFTAGCVLRDLELRVTVRCMGFRLMAPRSKVPDHTPNPMLWKMPLVPPPPVLREPPERPSWFDDLTEWAEREERSVFGVAGRLVFVCVAVLAVLYFWAS